MKKPLLLIGLLFLIAAWSWPGGYQKEMNGEDVQLNVDTFDSNLDSTITDVQKLAEAVDELVASGPGGGEANTASNLGGGLANYDSKDGVDLRFNSFAAADFNLATNLISIDYTNGQAADATHKGFLTSTDWSLFNGKAAGDHNHSGTYEPAVTEGSLPDSSVVTGDVKDGTLGDADINSTADVMKASFGITIDGGGSAITTGAKGYVEIPYAMTITANTVVCDQSGSIVIDVWKDTYANALPTDADSITASAPPTVSTAVKSQDSTLTGWTTAVSAGDVVGFNVDSATTVTRCTLTIKGNKT